MALPGIMRLYFLTLIFASNILLAQENRWDELFKKYEYFPLGDFQLNDLDSQTYILNARYYNLFEEENYQEQTVASGKFFRILGTPTHSEPFFLDFTLSTLDKCQLTIKQAYYRDLKLNDFDKKRFSRKEWRQLKRNLEYYNYETIPPEIRSKYLKDSIKFEYVSTIYDLAPERYEQLLTLIEDPNSFLTLEESRSTTAINKLRESGTITTYCVGVSFFVDYYPSQDNYISTITHKISNELYSYIDTLVGELINEGTLSELNKSW